MLKKCYMIILVVFTIALSGCSCNKNELMKENIELEKEIEKLENESSIYNGVGELFDFYNKLTIESVNSFVVVEASKIGGEVEYSDGVVVANNGYYYYVLTDYNKISNVSGYGQIKYRVMDSNAKVYEAEVASVYDEESALMLLRVNSSGENNVAMKNIFLGEVSDTLAHISSLNQINKIQLLDNKKTNTIVYSDVSYSLYSFDNTSVTNGALINSNNELCGIYLSNYDGFIDANLIRYIVYTTYSLAL